MTLHWHCKHFKDLTLEELYGSLQLRQAVFIVEQDSIYMDADDKDQDSYHLMGKDESGAIQAYARLTPKGISYDDAVSMSRIITSKQFRQKGYGKELVDRGLKKLLELFGEENVRIAAQVYLIKFYNEFGFTAVGEEYLEDGIPHSEMILTNAK